MKTAILPEVDNIKTISGSIFEPSLDKDKFNITFKKNIVIKNGRKKKMLENFAGLTFKKNDMRFFKTRGR